MMYVAVIIFITIAVIAVTYIKIIHNGLLFKKNW